MIFAVHYSTNSVGVEYIEADSVIDAQNKMESDYSWVPTIREIELVDEHGKGIDE